MTNGNTQLYAKIIINRSASLIMKASEALYISERASGLHNKHSLQVD